MAIEYDYNKEFLINVYQARFPNEEDVNKIIDKFLRAARSKKKISLEALLFSFGAATEEFGKVTVLLDDINVTYYKLGNWSNGSVRCFLHVTASRYYTVNVMERIRTLEYEVAKPYKNESKIKEVLNILKSMEEDI